MTGTAQAQGAAVRFPFPPLLFAAPLAVSLAVNKFLYPLALPAIPGISAVGGTLAAAGVGLGLSAVATMVRHRTTVVPHHPVTQLVTAGPYRISRNPMYAGMAVASVGVALLAGTWWPLVALPVSVLATSRLVIEPEEDYLGGRFGAEYERFRTRVRRWF